MNFAGGSSSITVPIITGYILQVTGAYLVALYFFAACAALYVLGSLLIDFQWDGPIVDAHQHFWDPTINTHPWRDRVS